MDELEAGESLEVKKTKYHLKTDFRSHVHSFFAHEPCERRKRFKVRSLAVDEALVVTKSEYHGRGDFRSYIGSLANKHGRKYTTRTFKHPSGWAVLRMK